MRCSKNKCENTAIIGCYCRSCYTEVTKKTPNEIKEERDAEYRHSINAAEME